MAAPHSVLSIVEEHRDLVYSGFSLGERGLTPVGSPTCEQWLQCLDYLIHLEQHIHFWIGDLLAYGERCWGTMYAEMIEQTGLDVGTLRNLKWVSTRVDVAQRRAGLTFAHHQEVVRLAPAQQEAVLARADEEHWTSRAVRQEAYRLTQSERALTPRAVALDPHLSHGDCRQVLTRFPDESFDLLLSDPPYGMHYVSPQRIVPFPEMVNDGETATEVLDGALAVSVRKLKPNSDVYIFSSWKTYREMADVVRRHFDLRNILVWVKNNQGVGDLEGGYGEQHELILFAQKGCRPLNGGCDGNVLPFDRVGTNQLRHPTQKPVALLEYLIGKSSHPGEVVVDPFMGSGSTCLAARRSQRRYIGIEIDQKWHEQALQRLAQPSLED